MSPYLLPVALIVLLAVAFAASLLWQRARTLALALAIGLPLVAIGWVAWRGMPAATAPTTEAPADVVAAPVAPRSPVATPTEQVNATFAELDRRVLDNPNDWEAWALKGRMHLQLQQLDAAVNALQMAHSIRPDDDTIGVAYAEALMRTSPDHTFPPEALALVERAAKATPPDPHAVFFLGMHRMQSGDPGAAADLWETLLPGLAPSEADALRTQIAAAREAAARIAGQPAPTAETGPAKVRP
jgi:cytochrome c-type biogenesis protein CcmH